LKPMEETEVDLKVPHDPISQIQAIEQYRKTGKREKRVVNTKNILFIMSGAFGDLAKIIKKRLQSQGLGFEADVRPTEVPWEILKEVTAQDLTEFGFESEFVGRLPVVVVFDELTKDDLFEILKNPNNPIILSKRLDFRAYGIDIKFEREALMMIAEMAAKERTGARGLVSAIEKVLLQFEKRLPTFGIKQFVVTPEVVDHPKRELERILEGSDGAEREERFRRAAAQEAEDIRAYVAERADEFLSRTGLEIYDKRMDLIAEWYCRNISDINAALDGFAEMYGRVRAEEAALAQKLDVHLSFDESAIDEIIRQAMAADEEPGTLAGRLIKKLEYGLNLVKDRSGIDTFKLDAEAVSDMESYVNRMIKQYYRREPEIVS
jgi:ATP-dependent Clp protease ATP-binding subunit ClpX